MVGRKETKVRVALTKVLNFDHFLNFQMYPSNTIKYHLHKYTSSLLYALVFSVLELEIS